MSNFVWDEIQRDRFGGGGVGQVSWRGYIATAATDMGDKVYVVIPGLSPDRRIGPCRWMARDATSLPARDDACLVQIDDTGDVWVTAWWPFPS